MAVEARFYVSEITKRPRNGLVGDDNSIGGVKLQVSTKGPNNWSEWTPTGHVEIGTVNPEALAWFSERLGKDVAVVFDDVPAGPSE